MVVTWPLDGRIVEVPSVTARIMRDGPGRRVAVQAPSAAVVTVASWTKAPDWLLGATRI
jgi:hypothetical protein